MRGSKRRSTCQLRASSSGEDQKPTAEPREIRGAQRRGLGDARAHDGHAEHVGLELHQQIVRGRAAVDAQLDERLTPRRFCMAASSSAL